VLLVGGAAELVGVLGHARVSAALSVLHVDPLVRTWVAVQAIISFVIGGTVWKSAESIRRGSEAAMDRARIAGLAFVGLVAASQLVLAWRLYPQLLDTPPPEPFPGYWLGSMIGAPLPPTLLALWLAFGITDEQDPTMDAGAGVRGGPRRTETPVARLGGGSSRTEP
jgi:hypothetical protein